MACLLHASSAPAIAHDRFDAGLAPASTRSLLRFITCGSVDDGKSTLIGRLLFDSKMVFDDQLDALTTDSRRSGTQGDALDLALLVDGLAAEREQGITIDVAYRFFATDTRKFIVADTPGHEQYTRNMVTGASTADLAIILIDARKGVLTQTRRHSHLVNLLGIRSLVLAVNKMDLVGYEQATFDRIVAQYRAFADEAGIEAFTAIPVSGLTGDNVITRSSAMTWYDGPSLIEHLEQVTVSSRSADLDPFRMAVQWVNRPDQDFRGYAGTIASGRVRVGDDVAILPAGRRSTVSRIVTFDGDLREAIAGQAVTLTFADEIDCARGDIVASAPHMNVDRIGATLIWMADEALVPRRSYWLKIGTRTLSANIDSVRSVIDVDSMAPRARPDIALNDIGEVEIDLDRSMPGILYSQNRRLGGFILIDKVTHATVAAGLVTGFPGGAAKPAVPHRDGAILWVVGATASDRSHAAVRGQERLRAEGRPTFVLDESALRDGLNADLGEDDAAEHLRRLREVARLISRAGVDVLVTADAPADEAYPGTAFDPGDDRTDAWVI